MFYTEQHVSWHQERQERNPGLAPITQGRPRRQLQRMIENKRKRQERDGKIVDKQLVAKHGGCEYRDLERVGRQWRLSAAKDNV